MVYLNQIVLGKEHGSTKWCHVISGIKYAICQCLLHAPNGVFKHCLKFQTTVNHQTLLQVCWIDLNLIRNGCFIISPVNVTLIISVVFPGMPWVTGKPVAQQTGKVTFIPSFILIMSVVWVSLFKFIMICCVPSLFSVWSVWYKCNRNPC